MLDRASDIFDFVKDQEVVAKVRNLYLYHESLIEESQVLEFLINIFSDPRHPYNKIFEDNDKWDIVRARLISKDNNFIDSLELAEYLAQLHNADDDFINDEYNLFVRDERTVWKIQSALDNFIDQKTWDEDDRRRNFLNYFAQELNDFKVHTNRYQFPIEIHCSYQTPPAQRGKEGEIGEEDKAYKEIFKEFETYLAQTTGISMRFRVRYRTIFRNPQGFVKRHAFSTEISFIPEVEQ